MSACTYTTYTTFPRAKLDSEINVLFLLNEHDDLYFLTASSVFFNFKKFSKKFHRKEKDIGESVQKSVLWNANYDRENNDYANALRPRRFKWWDFSTNFI